MLRVLAHHHLLLLRSAHALLLLSEQLLSLLWRHHQLLLLLLLGHQLLGPRLLPGRQLLLLLRPLQVLLQRRPNLPAGRCATGHRLIPKQRNITRRMPNSRCAVYSYGITCGTRYPDTCQV